MIRFRRIGPKQPGRRRPRRTGRSPVFEMLEQRALLAAGSASSFLATVPIEAVIHDAKPAGATSPSGLGPIQFRQLYGFNTVSFAGGLRGDGTGQTIAIVDAYNQPDIVSDLHAFDQQFGVPDPPSLKVVAQDGSANLPASAPTGEWGYEISLDVEWAHSLAPGANILLVEANSSGNDLTTAVQWAAAQPGVSVVSMSWGSAEFGGEQLDDSSYTTPAGHAGVTFLAATGDFGSPGDYPAASPDVLAVGGTQFSSSPDASGDYTTEAGWSSGGGGISLYEPQPSYQSGVVTQSTTARTTPDVSMDAGTGVAVYDSYDAPTWDWIDVGGTSLATPAWGALIAITDQGLAAEGKGPLGGRAAMTALYSLDGAAASLAFHDITTGSNGFAAGVGYDLVTGLGTPEAAGVAEGLSGDIAPPTGIAPTGPIAGEPTFQWSAVAGAASYHLVAYNQATSAKVLDVVVGGTTYTPNPGVFAPGQAYDWQVASETGLSAMGPAGTPVGFVMPSADVPTPSAPAKNAMVSTSTPTLQWSAVSGATAYALTLVDAANPSTTIDNQMVVSGTSYTFPTSLAFGHTYYWTVQAEVGPGVFGTASAYSTFSVAPLAAPGPLAPASGASVTTAEPTFQWTGIAGAASYGLTLVDLTAGTAPVTIVGITGTSYAPTSPLVNGDTYRWSVTADDAWGDVGTASVNQTVKISLPPQPVSAPLPSSPSGKVETTSPSLHWSAVAGAASYGVEIVDQTPGVRASAMPLAKVVGTTYVPNALLVAGHTYSWQVLAYNAAGQASGWSTALQFTVKDEATDDFDGTGVSEIGVFTPVIGLWTVVNPTTWSVHSVVLGQPNGQVIPVPGDYDGIGRTEMAYYTVATATWTIINPITGASRNIVFGSPYEKTIPIPGDYDGIGRTELALYVPSTATWYIYNPISGATRSVVWGVPNYWDVPVPGDYDGIGRTEIAGYAPSTATWYIWNPITNATRVVVWGAPNYWDIPAPGDYDGVGHTEIAAFVPANATWYVWNPVTNGLRIFAAGATNFHDIPLASPLGTLGALGVLGTPTVATTTAVKASVVTAAVPAGPAAVVTPPVEPPSTPVIAIRAAAVVTSWKTVGQSVPKGTSLLADGLASL